MGDPTAAKPELANKIYELLSFFITVRSRLACNTSVSVCTTIVRVHETQVGARETKGNVHGCLTWESGQGVEVLG